MAGEFNAGLLLGTRSRMVVALLVSVGLATVGADALNSLNVFFVTQNLDAASCKYGTLEMALGNGLVGRHGAARAVHRGGRSARSARSTPVSRWSAC
ncbi:hypothetical protein [Streptomyces sp. L2]|uniref:hypothetical protein n=1 Tax=Streptomyces sp. L2 TaxID=2162665 RepID=UPI00101385E0|nr:hypothetical protein [Streptomyces sp. L2]